MALSALPPRFPLLGKIVAIVLVLLALVVALQMVSEIVAEREGRLREAEASVAASLAGSQTVLGPILQRDCSETWEAVQGEGKERKVVTERRSWKLAAAPADLVVTGRVALEPRYRGIFKVNGYVMKATVAASWPDGAGLVPRAEHAGSRLACEPPTVLLALGDSRGVRSATVRVDDQLVAVRPGTGHPAHGRGFHVSIDDAWVGSGRPLAVQMAIELAGTGELAFAPVGDSTRVELASDWPHPSFAGRFLPLERTVSETGFDATWKLNALATTAPQQAVAGAAACAGGNAPADLPPGREGGRCVETFGVSFIDPVNGYTLSDRATKYGVLFIALTFLGVAGIEVLRQVRVHPIQYLLVGSGIAMFFLLLVSLGEHLPFAWAYLAASAACTALLAFYARFVLRGAKAGLAFGAAVAALYAVLYLLLQLEQRALLLGSLLLFAVLAALMFATRRVDWYGLIARLRGEADARST